MKEMILDLFLELFCTNFIEEVFQVVVVEYFPLHIADGIRIDDLVTESSDSHIRTLRDVE